MSIDLPRVDQDILNRWTEIDAFQRQLELSRGRPSYTFCDGPPFATGEDIPVISCNLLPLLSSSC